MITKIGISYLEALPIATGAARAANLDDNQRAVLRQHYGLDNDANLLVRNAGRGAVGDVIGSTLGGIAGAGAGAAFGTTALGKSYEKLLVDSPLSKKFKPLAALGVGIPMVTGAGAATGGFLGGLLGTKLMTDKYSRGNANKIIAAQQSLGQ